jgi:hypothetical protein
MRIKRVPEVNKKSDCRRRPKLSGWFHDNQDGWGRRVRGRLQVWIYHHRSPSSLTRVNRQNLLMND